MEHVLKALGEVLRDKDFTIGMLRDQVRRLEKENKELKEALRKPRTEDMEALK